MRKHWTAFALACVLIAQTPAPASAEAATPPDNLAAWGIYAQLAGQTMQDTDPTGKGFRLHWRWETPGQVLALEWSRDKDKPDKAPYTATVRLGPEAGTLVLKTNFLMHKEWVGTLHEDGTVSYVGKGMLKMPYSIRISEQGNYEEIYDNGYVIRYAAITNSATPAAVAQTTPSATPASTPAPTLAPAPASTPVVAAPPPGPATSERPAPVVAKQQTVPPAKPIKAPRQLTAEDMQKLQSSVQRSRTRSVEQARQAELQRQEAARQAELNEQRWAAERAQREAEEAAAEAEMEADRQQKAAAWNAMAQANEQALNDSLQNLRDTAARAQAQQAEAAERQRAQADAAAQAERRRQVELIRQANQRQDDDAARYAAQRQQYDQQRANTQAADLQETQRRRDEQAAQEAQRRRDQQVAQEAQRRRDEQSRQDAADRARLEQQQQQRRDTVASLTRSAGSTSAPGKKMCSHPESKVHLYEPRQDVEKEKARACGNIGRSITETGRKCDSINWCSVDLVCGPWEAECPSGASAQ